MEQRAQSGDSKARPVPRGLLLQWHVTERCNLRCSHCYQEQRASEELPFAKLLEILNQYKELLDLLRRQRPRQPRHRVRGQITVTGGEPFMRHDFFDLLDEFATERKCFSYAILTNGTLIDKSTARRLRRLRPAFVQVSLDGSPATHDAIRGPGSFEKTVSGLKLLIGRRIRTMISFTAHRRNYREFPSVARLGRKLGVSRIWADRLIPTGSGSAMRDLVLTPDETAEFFQIMLTERTSAARSWFGRTEIAMHRALQFLATGGRPYHCTAGESLLTVGPNGDLYPCRRMPIGVGNLMEVSLAELYSQSDVLCRLRDRSRTSHGCEDCCHRPICRGGLKCLSYAMCGDPFTADPGCPVAWRRNGT
jgi:radical SAM protein with 4Fe4S-binding SPASM domain